MDQVASDMGGLIHGWLTLASFTYINNEHTVDTFSELHGVRHSAILKA